MQIMYYFTYYVLYDEINMSRILWLSGALPCLVLPYLASLPVIGAGSVRTKDYRGTLVPTSLIRPAVGPSQGLLRM